MTANARLEMRTSAPLCGLAAEVIGDVFALRAHTLTSIRVLGRR